MSFKISINHTNDLETTGGNLQVHLSPDSGNGLQIQNGKLVGVKGPQGDPGTGTTQNQCGNAMGNGEGAMPIVSMNSAVSRHKKCHNTSLPQYTYIKDNEGPVMSDYDGYMSDHGSIAYFMYNNINTFPVPE